MTTLDPGAIERREIEARRLADATWPAPWNIKPEPDEEDGWYIWAMPGNHQVVCGEIGKREEADFIAWCRTGVPALCDDIKALQGALAEADAVIAASCSPEPVADNDFERFRRHQYEAIERHDARARQEAKPHE